MENENKTYLNKINEILNTNRNDYVKTKNNKSNISSCKKFQNRINNSFSNLNLNKKLIRKKSFICFNKENNQSFLCKNKEDNFLIISDSNFKINKADNEKKIKNSKCINIKNSIFNFERLSRLKKSNTQNETKISVDKFNNGDGSKDDIIYKINKIKYLSPKMNSKKTEKKFLIRPKIKKIEKYLTNNLSRFESSIKYAKTLLNKIKLDNNLIKSKDYNSNNDIINSGINYFKIEDKPNEFNKKKIYNLINSNPGRNARLKYLYFKKINKHKTLNKDLFLNFSNNDSLNDDK